jgi:hypothetical protein
VPSELGRRKAGYLIEHIHELELLQQPIEPVFEEHLPTACRHIL